MKLSHLILQDHILANPQMPACKAEILEKVLSSLWQNSTLREESIERQAVMDALLERERDATTAIGEGFAFPHARMLGLEGFYLFLVVSEAGFDFDSIDGQPVHFLILALVSREQPSLLLKSRAAIMRFFSPGRRPELLGIGSSEQLWQELNKSGIDVEQEVLARDIMHPVVGVIRKGMSMREAASELHRHHVDSLPVVDDADQFWDVLSCHDLFRIGLPDFFMQLNSISFVKHMNPFERYFRVDRSRTVGELQRHSEVPTIGPDATLMEIVFELTVRNFQQLYVVEAGKLLGTVDRFSIIDKILVSKVGR